MFYNEGEGWGWGGGAKPRAPAEGGATATTWSVHNPITDRDSQQFTLTFTPLLISE